VTQDGPKMIVKYTCEGCIHLETEDWRFYGENDETDSGTSAHCKAADKFLSSYWNSNQVIPAWCPRVKVVGP
jgi:hypothetical protein